MSTQQAQVTTFTIQEKKKQSGGLKSIMNKYLFHWPLFFIGVILTVSFAFVYSQLAKPVYEIKATLLIKDEKKTPEQQPTLHEIEVLN